MGARWRLYKRPKKVPEVLKDEDNSIFKLALSEPAHKSQ